MVDATVAPTAHGEIVAYCAAMGARPRWVVHAATQVERMLDMVAAGTGIGWLNSWQATQAATRTDVAVRPLTPVALFDDFRVAWRAGDTAAIERLLLKGMKESPAYYQSLVVDRNRRWIPRIESCLAAGNCFIVVGAAHMVGSDGLIAMLKEKGYRIVQQ